MIIIGGIVLLIIGAGLTWLAMKSPVQTQPLGLIAILAGAGMTLFGLGGL